MGEFILELLEQHIKRGGSREACFMAEGLLAVVSNPAANEARLDTLARHVLDCAVCARRWEIIQRDPHVDLAELYALERLSDDLFVKLRAEAHVERCSSCRHSDQALRNLVIAENPRSVHYGNLVASLRQMPQLAVSLRSEVTEKLAAIVLEEDGRPCLRDDQIERVTIPVGRALLTEQGLLTVQLKVPSDYSSAQLAISRGDQTVMFPQAVAREDGVEFVAETRVQGDECTISSSQLALWVTRR